MHDDIAVFAATSTLALVASVVVSHAMAPSLPQVGLDASWVAATGDAAERPPLGGIDVDFAYGPASPLVTGYPSTEWLTRTLSRELGFAVLLGWCAAVLMTRHQGLHPEKQESKAPPIKIPEATG